MVILWGCLGLRVMKKKKKLTQPLTCGAPGQLAAERERVLDLEQVPDALTPNTVELIPTLGALPPRGGPVQDPGPPAPTQRLKRPRETATPTSPIWFTSRADHPTFHRVQFHRNNYFTEM